MNSNRYRFRPIQLLLLVPFLGLLDVAYYNLSEPQLLGFPFFYWYQLLWVPVTVALMWVVYRSTPHDD
jgi:hypothetical protein